MRLNAKKDILAQIVVMSVIVQIIVPVMLSVGRVSVQGAGKVIAAVFLVTQADMALAVKKNALTGHMVSMVNLLAIILLENTIVNLVSKD